MICVGLIYAAFCIWYAKVPSDMIITQQPSMQSTNNQQLL